MDKCREEFEKWLTTGVNHSADIPEEVKQFLIEGLWNGWQAAWNARQPEPAVKQFLTVAEPGRWIPVTERLPEVEQFYIIHAEGAVIQAVWFKGAFSVIKPDGEVVRFDNITHWQPLPEPPTRAAGGAS